ncbi:MAG: tripartite tricarboxylate transporter substrate binding protein, partial [Burkholderiales bacterium]|nr:tripartite tricarboxylate transporter substrate binding protein [Burkholderiales bacterium]
VSPASLVVPLVSAGKLRALANASDRRSQQLPDVPTVAEAGHPDATVVSWFGFHVPVATPQAVINRIAASTRTAAAAPEVQSRVTAAGGEIFFQGEGEFEAFLRAEAGRWERAARMIRR